MQPAEPQLQSPTVTVGKTVTTLKKAARGVVMSVDGGSATVEWGSSKRIKPVRLDSLLALPIANAASLCRPSAAGQRVLVNGGTHAHKQGVIDSFNMCAALCTAGVLAGVNGRADAPVAWYLLTSPCCLPPH